MDESDAQIEAAIAILRAKVRAIDSSGLMLDPENGGFPVAIAYALIQFLVADVGASDPQHDHASWCEFLRECLDECANFHEPPPKGD
jgi:hypothetical protein